MCSKKDDPCLVVSNDSSQKKPQKCAHHFVKTPNISPNLFFPQTRKLPPPPKSVIRVTNDDGVAVLSLRLDPRPHSAQQDVRWNVDPLEKFRFIRRMAHSFAPPNAPSATLPTGSGHSFLCDPGRAPKLEAEVPNIGTRPGHATGRARESYDC